VLVDLAGDIALETANDVGLGQALFGPLTAVPARLGGRRPVTETLQAELA
jgi:hypothetical protein